MRGDKAVRLINLNVAKCMHADCPRMEKGVAGGDEDGHANQAGESVI